MAIAIHLIFNNVTTNTHLEKNLFNKRCWQNWTSTCQRLKLDPHLSPCTEIKWNQDLGSKPTMMKSPRKTDKISLDLNTGKDFLNRTRTAQGTAQRTGKSRGPDTAKETESRVNGQTQNERSLTSTLQTGIFVNQ